MDEIERLSRAAQRGDALASGRLAMALLERRLLGSEHAESLVRGLPKIGSGVRRGGGWTRGLNRSSVRIPLPPSLLGVDRDVQILAAWKGIREWNVQGAYCRNVYSGHLTVWSEPRDAMLAVRVRKARDMRRRTILPPGWDLVAVAEAIEASYRWAVEVIRLRNRVRSLVAADDDEALDELAGPPGHRRNLFMSAVTLIKLDMGLLTTD